MLLINAALGDVKPMHGGVEGIEKTGEIFAEYFLKNLDKQGRTHKRLTYEKPK